MHLITMVTPPNSVAHLLYALIVKNQVITPADNYENLFILWFRLDFRVFNFIMVKNFFNF
jgi:hypothetical protein